LVRAVERINTQPNEAWDDLMRAGELDPSSTVVWQNKAYLASEVMKDDAKAIQCLDKVLELQPFNLEGLSGRAVLYARAGNSEAAGVDIANALKLSGFNSGPTEYHAACVFALLAKNDPPYQDQANKYLARALHHGYGLELLDSDPDLANLRESQAFRDILQIRQLIIDSESSELKD
jgi:tetratricopeptide (TPR) repeat protein